METEHPNRERRSAAYAEIAKRFRLKARQRDLLDASPQFRSIINAAVAGDWEHVSQLLFDERIAR